MVTHTRWVGRLTSLTKRVLTAIVLVAVLVGTADLELPRAGDLRRLAAGTTLRRRRRGHDGTLVPGEVSFIQDLARYWELEDDLQ